jgi:type IV secretion system protein VirB10
MKQSPELEALSAVDEAGVSNKNAKRNQKAAMVAFLLAGVAMVYFIMKPSERPDNFKPGDEQFNTTNSRPPSFTRDKVEQTVAPEPQVINLPPPPPLEEPAAPQIAEEFPQRFRSKLIEIDRSQASASSEDEGADGGPSVAGGDRNSKFLATASTMGTRTAKATKIKRIDAVVPEGTLIPGILETAIVSDLPGQIRAITSEDVYSFDGRRVLIPMGTRLIGEYQSDVMTGQTRVFVIWTRLLRDDGVSVRLNSIGTDSLGRSGLTGNVDKKWRERFGASIMLSIVGAGASYLMGYGSDNSSGQNNYGAQQAEALARQTIAQTFSEMANTALSDNLRIKPTISVHQGERIFIFVRQDLDFSAMYDDPVTEAIKDIRRERSGK